MKKAILITGIIWLVLCVAGAVIELFVGIGDLMGMDVGWAKVDPNQALGAANIVLGSLLAIGAILDVVLLAKRNSENLKKGPGIALGVISVKGRFGVERHFSFRRGFCLDRRFYLLGLGCLHYVFFAHC